MTWGFDNHVVDVYFDTLAHYMAEDFIHQSLISCSCVFQAERHDLVKVVSIVTDEGVLFMSVVDIKIWLYLEYVSKKLRTLLSAAPPTSRSMLGRE